MFSSSNNDLAMESAMLNSIAFEFINAIPVKHCAGYFKGQYSILLFFWEYIVYVWRIAEPLEPR